MISILVILANTLMFGAQVYLLHMFATEGFSTPFVIGVVVLWNWFKVFSKFYGVSKAACPRCENETAFIATTCTECNYTERSQEN